MTKEQKTENFIKKAKLIHKNENLDYSKVDYINNKTHVIIIDHDLDENGNEYGEFSTMPTNFLKGQGHPAKRAEKISKSKRFSQEEIIKRFKEVHKGEDLDYSKVKYVNMHTKVCIIDPIYGEYWQEPNVHLKGCCHPHRKTQRKTLTTEEFIQKAQKIHENFYNYSKTIYKNYREKVTIICPKHGEFIQSAENHLYGKGCPQCGNHFSKYEDEIISLLKDKFIKNDREILDGKELDILIPSKQIAIEFNGLKWHSDWFAGKDRHYHIDKTKECINKGIKLIQIFEDEYNLHKNVVISKLNHLLNYSQNLEKIYARKSQLKEITKNEAFDFLEKNHLQGAVMATVYLGAFYNEKLVSVMTFIKESENKWNLNRFASDINYNCIGFGGKLFAYFIKKYKPKEVKSFADRRWTINNENLYTQIGFQFVGYTQPDYKYILIKNPSVRFHKFGFRKKILLKKYKTTNLINNSMTESEMAKALGYDRIWDCGLIKYIWKQETNN